MDSFPRNTKIFISQDINWWTGVVWITCGSYRFFYKLFGLGFWWHPFTAEDLLANNNVNDVMKQHFSKSVLLKKRTLHLKWSEGEYISANFHFRVKCSFNRFHYLILITFLNLAGPSWSLDHVRPFWTSNKPVSFKFQKESIMQYWVYNRQKFKDISCSCYKGAFSAVNLEITVV